MASQETASSNPDEFARLLSRLRSKDEAAWCCLNEKLYGPLKGHVLGFQKDRNLAADAVQEAFLELTREIDQPLWNTEKALHGWMYRVARNKAIQVIRKRAKDTKDLGDADVPEESEDDTGIMVAILEAGATREKLLEAIQRLTEVEQRLVTMKHLEGLSYEEIAHNLDLAIGTCKNKLSLAMGKLRAILAGPG